MTVTRFVLLPAPRTGSNWLCTLLDSHPDILCHHELYNPEGIHLALDRRDGSLSLGTLAERERDPLGLLERAWAAHLGHAAVGFKLNLGQSEAVFRAVLADRGVLKLVLGRRNRVKTFVSEVIARETARWESYGEAGGDAPAPRIRVDPAALLAHAERNRDHFEELRRALSGPGHRVLETGYEDLESARERERILGFLGVRTLPLTSRTFKRETRDLRDVIENFSEVEAALRGTGLEHELASQEP